MNYYNEFDTKAAEWLRNLIKAGLIPEGDVDERSIEDVVPSELLGYTQCHFFAGISGWSLALELAGWPRSERIWTGSCPCQPFSAAGQGAGFADERDLWPAWLHLIAQCRPPVIFGEQVEASIKHGWLDRTVSDLEGRGYAVGSAVYQASAVGAQHRRNRLWFVAHTERREGERPHVREAGRMGRISKSVPWDTAWQSALPIFRAMDDGLSRCVAGTNAARNAIVPQAAAEMIGAYLDVVAARAAA